MAKWPGTTLLGNDISVEKYVGSTEQASIPAESKTLHWKSVQEQHRGHEAGAERAGGKRCSRGE